LEDKDNFYHINSFLSINYLSSINYYQFTIAKEYMQQIYNAEHFTKKDTFLIINSFDIIFLEFLRLKSILVLEIVLTSLRMDKIIFI